MVVYWASKNGSSIDNKQLDLGFDWSVFHLTSHMHVGRPISLLFFIKQLCIKAMVGATNNQKLTMGNVEIQVMLTIY